MPKAIRDAIVLMVRGKPDDEDGKCIDFIEAAKLCGVKPDVMRKWLDRAEARAFLRAERQAYRAAVCAGNEMALQRVRDKSENGMAVIGSVRALEQLDEAETRAPPRQLPGLVLVIQNVGASGPSPTSPAPTIDATPGPAPTGDDD